MNFDPTQEEYFIKHTNADKIVEKKDKDNKKATTDLKEKLDEYAKLFSVKAYSKKIGNVKKQD